MNETRYRKFLVVMQDLLSGKSLSGYSIRIAGLSLIDHEIAALDGRVVEGPECMAWARKKLQDLELL